MATLKELTHREDRLAGGHRLCPGCGASIAVRQVLLGAGEDPVVAGCATGCLEVSTTIYPYTSWRTPFIHNAFENAAATISGVEAAFQGLKRAGKIPADKRVKFVAFGGDGGTYDIGLQSLSGAMERGHDMVYVCYDNGAYMNTGIQRSSATPKGAWATTAQVGPAQQGKQQRRKDLTQIMAAHGIPYVAQASVSHWKDLTEKAAKAFAVEGPAFINVFAPCPRGWRIPHDKTIEIAKLAVQTGFWPLYEVEDGVWRQTVKVVNRKPIEEFLRPQGRFKHLFAPGNEHLLAEIQADVDRAWEQLQKRFAKD
ncbi:thiamine pyrophosphate-dependent enzyme [Coriobacteriia bacterium Es71-Z0120]|uniref:thiamine pyrophosphate-dependent enzyme n=1 Tax=Parvivirga hydrogeniphila TaxID=2939460 RepID=UPI002260D6BE|nr:thiamine pyrophosphate-dependent enzyme [Parvivirga hydrogeniphila]MCL4078330.1 thiamine pyrophosphate-dependent enzyme [Parvivirga hydrogeniphila]